VRPVRVRAVGVAAVACALVVVFGSFLGPLRILFALALVLILPGYALVRLLFAGQALDGARTAVFAVALSIATTILVTLALNVVPGGVRAWTWACALALVTCAASAVAAERAGPTRLVHSQLRRGVNRRDVALILLACAVLGTTIGLATTPLGAANARGYSAMWLERGSSAGKPAVRVTIACVERQRTSYRVVVEVGGNARRIIRNIELRPGEERALSVQVRTKARRVRVKALLFRATAPFVVYRRTTLWLQTTQVTR
jgi:uncharacterized membrane protein